MKIKLTVDLPINEKHKCFTGSEFEVYARKGRRDALYYFKDHNGIECAAYTHEFEVLEGHPSELPNREDKSNF